MKLILDQGLPRSTVAFLAQRGIDAVHVGDIGMASATDVSILDKARAEEFVVVTLDADFHMLMAFSGRSRPSIIRIRIEGLCGRDLADLLKSVLASCETDLAKGAMVSVQENRIRVRMLPIIK